MQEVITLTVFATFSVLYLGERITSNHLVGFALICGGAFFIFKGPLRPGEIAAPARDGAVCRFVISPGRTAPDAPGTRTTA
jgi:hypothetical protein